MEINSNWFSRKLSIQRQNERTFVWEALMTFAIPGHLHSNLPETCIQDGPYQL